MKKEKDEEVHYSNPFATSTTRNVERKKKIRATVVDKETGEVLGDSAYVPRQHLIDYEPFIKVYPKMFKLMSQMSSETWRLFDYIIDHLEINKSTVLLRYTEVIESGYLKQASSYYRALGQLKDMQIIAKSVRRGFYYINMNLFFKGDRTKAMKEMSYSQKKKDDGFRIVPKEELEQERRSAYDYLVE